MMDFNPFLDPTKSRMQHDLELESFDTDGDSARGTTHAGSLPSERTEEYSPSKRSGSALK